MEAPVLSRNLPLLGHLLELRKRPIELFWRVRLNPFVSLTPNVQVIIDPARNAAEDRVTVAGLRLQLDF